MFCLLFEKPVLSYGRHFDRENEALRPNNTVPWQTSLETTEAWSNPNVNRIICGFRPRRSRTYRFRDDDQLGRSGGDSYGCRAGVGEAHGRVKTERGADCCTGIPVGGAGVANESIYPDH